MAATSKTTLSRLARHSRIRKKVVGLPTRLRLSVFRSHQHLYAQIIDDTQGKTLIGCSTQDESLKLKSGGSVPAAEALGKLVAARAVEKGIKQVVFDRGGYPYHGRVKAFADAIRSGGLEV